MLELHCPRCGGLVGNPTGTTDREASNAAPPVPVGYGPREPSLWELQGGGVHRIRSASRN